MNLNTIFFIGPQGSGKGTQAKILSAKLNFFYWEMGGILRQIATEPTALGQKIKGMIDNGVLLSDSDLYEVLDTKLETLPKEQGVIFDGVPRRLAQAEHLIKALKGFGRTDFTTLFINLPKEESLNRLLKRAEIEKRADDTREKIEYRLEQYQKDTVPVLSYLKSQGEFFEIDGRPEVETVTQNINKVLNLQ